jgi:predicted ATP-grasp superfamily ATP-dependent carboligase
MVKKTNQTPVVIVGGGVTTWGVIRGLRGNCIPIYVVSQNPEEPWLKSRYIQKTFILNPNSQDYVSSLIRVLDKSIKGKPILFIAGDDDALEVLSQNHKELSKSAILSFPDWNVVSSVIDKHKTYKLAEDLCIPTIQTRSFENQKQLNQYLVSDNKLNYPVFLKSIYSRRFLSLYKTKGIICNSDQEVSDAYAKYDGINNSVILQEYLKGDVDNIYAVLLVLDKDSNIISSFVNEKICAASYLGSTSLSISRKNQKLVEYASMIASRLHYYGVVGVQFKYDPDYNNYKLLEINGRFSVSIALAVRCGLNYPLLLYKCLDSKDYSKLIIRNYSKNIILWYPLNEIKSFFTLKYYIGIDRLFGLGYLVEPFSLRDPFPSIIIIFRIFKKIIRKLYAKNIN